MLDHITVWFVTGCSSGLGKSLASTIHTAGHFLVATARNIDTLNYLPDGPSILKLNLDVTSPIAITKCFSTALDKFGRIDIVINNAGYSLFGDTEAIPESDARLQMETIFWGPVLITREAVRIFREVNPAGQGGTVVQVSSIGGYVTFPGNSFYHAGKYALGAFTQSFSKELEPSWNIKLMVAAPGGVRTNFLTNAHVAARHPAYAGSNGPFSQMLGLMTRPDVQENFSAPDDLARVLFDVVVGQDERSLPARFLMGAETRTFIESECKKDADEMEAWKVDTIRCTSK
ncbi:hypothetical protein N7520_007564 [Penicillium odoratum]|uniref:uncharacterized protein n=1 Tax=Penicillium odoratum TaxID=1167516 RepID=UPI0025498AB5|nr:uncharacterized protein N7520_007564 [Penicillium odoratum]KAJ5760408.1 hypothetical protein N7520_007564 [Penicillium odoratum]